MRKVSVFLFLFCLCVLCSVAFCSVPAEIRYTGRLSSYRELVNSDSLTIKFEIFSNATGNGNLLWSQVKENVKVSSGIFNCTLNPSTDVFKNENLYLQVTVAGKTLMPREKITSQMFSLRSESAEKLVNENSTNGIQITVGTTTVYLKATDNGISIQTSNGCIEISNNKIYSTDNHSAKKNYLGVPPGTVIAFAGSEEDIPQGYFLCNGQTVSITEYKELYDALGQGSIYGSDAQTFRLPDFRGMFLRGNGKYDNGNEVDYPSKDKRTVYQSEELGKMQGDAIRNITGNMYKVQIQVGVDGVFSKGDTFHELGQGHTMDQHNILFDASRVVPTDKENRPVNYSVNYCIKY